MLPEDEPLIGLKEVCNIPRVASFRGGRGVSLVTIYRWRSIGVRGVRLETTRLGGQVATSVAAVKRFIDAVDGAPALEVRQGRAQRAAEVNQAAARLKKELAPRRPRVARN